MQSRKTKGLKLGGKTVNIFVDREEILMKTFVSVALAGVFLAVMASADPVFGVWKLSQEAKEIMLMWKLKSVMERFVEK